MELCIGEDGARRSTFKWNISHLRGETADALRERWSSLPEGSSFFHKLRSITRLFRQISKQKAKEFRKEELDARAKLEVSIAALHEDVYNVDKQGEVSRLNNILEEIETRKARGATIRARVKWQQVGDKCSTEFFKSVRQKNSQTVLSELRDKHGRCFNKKEDLDKICYDFYKDLYGHKEVSEGALEEVFEGFQATFTEAMNESLTKEITERELGGVVRDMAKEKAPGHDGIPTELFQKLWSTIGNDFHQMLLRSMERGVLHEGITKGVISLIPKEGDGKDLNYWRPITLLTVIYKIFAKTLQLRLQPILRDVISPEQTAFLPLRFILDNIILTQETLHWARTSRQPTVFLKLDFSKAYDKVSWRFLFHTMHKMGINAQFIGWVKLLFGNASAAVNINGSPGSNFKVERGVRQGCPLASYLFLIVGEALTHVFKKEVTKGRLKGVVLPGGKETTVHFPVRR